MSTVSAAQEVILGLKDNGILMTPEEFDAIEEYDENYQYELVRGVLVVNPIPLAEERGPNDLLGYFLQMYKSSHPQGATLDYTLPQEYVRTPNGRRIADRVIWAGLGRLPGVRSEVPTVAVAFVSAGRRNQRRDYVDKRQDYREAGIAEYWIIDRFGRTLTVIQHLASGKQEHVIGEKETYQSPHLPGFDLPLAQLLTAADRLAEMEE